MSFQIKDFVSIVASIINHARAVTTKVTDFAPGSVARTLMEAPAVEIEELYLQYFLGLRDAIPVSTFLSFGFNKLPSKRAFGYASVSSATPLTQAITIPLGTVFTTDAAAEYTSTEDVVWAIGSNLVLVPVQATATGLAGNVAQGIITKCALFDSSNGFVVGNSLISNGADEETDQEREARFAEFIGSLSRGTVPACRYAASQAVILDLDGNIDQFVTRVGITETPGRVSIYVYSNRGIASAALMAVGQVTLDGQRLPDGTIVPGYRPAGVRVDVLPMAERTISMSIAVTMLPGFTITSAVQQELVDIYSSSIRGIAPGDTLYLGTLIESLLVVSGVSAIIPQATQNITCAASEALVPGALTIITP